MKILRAIVAVVAGYVLFAGASMLLERFGPVMTQQGPLMVVVVLLALALIGLVVGSNARIIAGGCARPWHAGNRESRLPGWRCRVRGARRLLPAPLFSSLRLRDQPTSDFRERRVSPSLFLARHDSAGDHLPRGERLSVTSVGSLDLIESLFTGCLEITASRAILLP